VHYAFEHAPAAAQKQLRGILGHADVTTDDLQKVQTILTECGAIEYTQKLAHDYILRAKQQLAAQPFGSHALQHLLHELLEYSVTRQK